MEFYYSGIVSKIRIIKQLRDRPLIRFSLKLSDDTFLNCLIASHSLNFFADVTDGMHLSVFGQINSRKQFVVKKYVVIGKTKLMLEMEHLAATYK